jgi:hypothetical protein
MAHRLAYELLVGPIPDGLTLDHLCRTRNCINPWHLEPCTLKENQLRSPVINANKTHCRNGHEYTEENTRHYVRKGGAKMRTCRKCDSIRTLRRYHARKK